MSVLIKGMEIPKSCYVCPFCDYASARCDAVKGNPYTQESRYEKRDDFCPLVPVQPHGLIDREQILDSIRIELAQANAVNDMEDYDSWMQFFDYVRKFPTVIQASDE